MTTSHSPGRPAQPAVFAARRPGALRSVERRRADHISAIGRPDGPVEAEAERVAGGREEHCLPAAWSFAAVPLTPPETPRHEALDARLGEGRPLAPAIRPALEAQLGAGLGAVRVHDEQAAADLTRRVGAEAVTVGTDIAFAPGRFDPRRSVGRRLLVHELAHVMQQAAHPIPGVGMRQPKPGAPPVAAPTTLDALPEDDRKKIQAVTTTSVNVPGIDDKFSTKGATTTSAFPGDTTMVWDASVPTALRRGLTNVAGSLSAGVELTPAPLSTNASVTLHLDLTAYGGTKGLYRFTRVADPARKGRATSTGRIIVESLGVVTPLAVAAVPTAVKGATPAKDAVADKIRDHAISVSYVGAERDALRAAIAQVPSSHLAIIRGVRFARAAKDAADPAAAGNYNPKTHAITMFDSAFAATQVAFKASGATASSFAARAIVHEIGHAVDFAPLRESGRVKDAADAAVAKLPRDHPDPANPRGYRWDSKEAKADIDARLATQQKAERQQLAARGRSGSQTIKTKSGDFEDVVGREVVKGGFREAAKKDGPKAVSTYGDKDWQENYAEAYSLYLTSPSTLRALRPNVFDYLARTLPK